MRIWSRAVALRHRTTGGVSLLQRRATSDSQIPDSQILKPSNPQISGFTLIELLVVLSIIIILASMGLVQYRSSVIRSREAVLKEDLFRMRDAIDQYYADKGQYPSGLESLVSDGYLRKVPKDPFTDSDATWQAIPAEPDPANPSASSGIYDVKSGSDQAALDGSKYADW